MAIPKYQYIKDELNKIISGQLQVETNFIQKPN